MRKKSVITFAVGLSSVIIFIFYNMLYSAGGYGRSPVLFAILHLLSAYGVAIAFYSIICFIFPKQIVKKCTKKTTVLSLVLSFTAAIGLLSLAVFLLFYLDSSFENLIFPIAVTIFMICYFTLLLLFRKYCILRKASPSAAGVFIDIFFAVLNTFLFLYTLVISFILIFFA